MIVLRNACRCANSVSPIFFLAVSSNAIVAKRDYNPKHSALSVPWSYLLPLQAALLRNKPLVPKVNWSLCMGF